MGIEETYMKKLEGILRGVRIGTMDTEDNNFYSLLRRFEKINPDLAEDYQERYIKLVQGNKKLVS
jgi:hypothetical protein